MEEPNLVLKLNLPTKTWHRQLLERKFNLKLNLPTKTWYRVLEGKFNLLAHQNLEEKFTLKLNLPTKTWYRVLEGKFNLLAHQNLAPPRFGGKVQLKVELTHQHLAPPSFGGKFNLKLFGGAARRLVHHPSSLELSFYSEHVFSKVQFLGLAKQRNHSR